MLATDSRYKRKNRLEPAAKVKNLCRDFRQLDSEESLEKRRLTIRREATFGKLLSKTYTGRFFLSILFLPNLTLITRRINRRLVQAYVYHAPEVVVSVVSRLAREALRVV